MNLRTLHRKQKIADMSRKSVNSKLGESTKPLIDNFFRTKATKPINWSYANNYEIDVEGDCELNMQGVEELPSYINFNDIYGNFVLDNVNDLKNTYGFPKRIYGDFTINGTNRLARFNTNDFPSYVKGVVHFHNCRHIGTENIDEFGDFIRDSLDDEDAEPLTEEQQEILDFASNILSEEELNDLEDYFYNCNQ